MGTLIRLLRLSRKKKVPPNNDWASLPPLARLASSGASREAGHNIEKILDGDLDGIVKAFQKTES